MRYFFEICYNGTRYNGWQTQNNATGIQSVVEESLAKILRQEIKIVASGRTDTGVHCLQQFFHVDLPSGTDKEKLYLSINSMLPPDIVIPSIRQVVPDAHARYDAIERVYQYKIVRRKDPFKHGFAWHFFKPLDMKTMQVATALLVGTLDFQCFSKVKTDVNHFICNVKRADWTEDENELEFTVVANRFLRGMVRSMVGTLIDVGLGRTSVEDVRQILESRDRKEAGQNVPPYGLYLVKVNYPENIFLNNFDL
jgi:tRNA pseudouridine38-40 synthase